VFGSIKHSNPPPEKIKSIPIYSLYPFVPKLHSKGIHLRRNSGSQNEFPDVSQFGDYRREKSLASAGNLTTIFVSSPYSGEYTN